MTATDENPLGLLPELLLAGAAVAGLLLGSWLPRRRQYTVAVLSALACLAAATAAVVAAPGPAATAFGGAYALDPLTTTVRLVLSGATLLVTALSLGPLRGHPRESEYHVLVLLTATGSLLLAGAQDVLLIAAAYLLASIPGYALAGFAKDGPGTEAALKFYVLGALGGVVLLTGTTLLYAATGTTAHPEIARAQAAPAALLTAGTLGVLGGLLVKAGAVPGHFWLPDTVRGSAPPVAALLTTLPKAGALTALFRLGAVPLAGSAVPWPALLATLAAASMTLGNLAALLQRDVRRLLAYSAISQVGYLLMPVAVAGRTALAQPAFLYYVAAYALTNLGAFAVVCALPRATTTDTWRGLVRHRPLLAGSLAVCLLGLVGTPPTAVFLGKLEAFAAAFDAGYGWLAVLAAANTLVSLFYYLRWLAPAFTPGPAPPTGNADRLARGTAHTAAAASLALGVAAGPVLALFTGPAPH